MTSTNKFFEDDQGITWYVVDGRKSTGLSPEEVKSLDTTHPGWRELPREEVVEIFKQPVLGPPPLKFPWEMDLDLKVAPLVDRCFPAAGVGCLYAQPGIGKSAVAVDLAFRIASGMPDWANQRIARHGDVVYVAMEGDEALRSFIRGWRREHPHEFAGARVAFYMVAEAGQELKPLVTKQRDTDGTDMFLHPGIGQLRSWIKEKGLDPRLIILDTQVDMMDPSVSENDSAPSAQMYAAAERLGHDLGCFVLFLHHAVKTHNRTDKPTYRGSTAFGGKADVMAYLRGVTTGRGDGLLVIDKRKPFGGNDPHVRYQGVRDEHEDDLCVSWESPEASALLDDPEVEAEHRRARTIECIWTILDEAPNPMSTAGVANALRELVTRETDRIDVYFMRGKHIGPLLDELNTEGVVVNLEATMTNGKAAKWVSGHRPASLGLHVEDATP